MFIILNELLPTVAYSTNLRYWAHDDQPWLNTICEPNKSEREKKESYKCIYWGRNNAEPKSQNPENPSTSNHLITDISQTLKKLHSNQRNWISSLFLLQIQIYVYKKFCRISEILWCYLKFVKFCLWTRCMIRQHLIQNKWEGGGEKWLQVRS